MDQPKKSKAKQPSSLLEALIGANPENASAVPQGLQLADHTATVGTSISQIKKAGESGGSFKEVIRQKNQEAQAIRDKEDADQIRKEGLNTPQSDFEVELKENLGDKFEGYKVRQEKLQDLNKRNTDLLDSNGVNLFAPLYWLHDAIVGKEDALGKTKNQEKEADKLNKEQFKDIGPTLKKYDKNYKASIKSKEEQIEALKKAGHFNSADLAGGLNPTDLEKENTDAINKLEISLSYDKKSHKLVDDYLTGKNTVWDGLLNSGRDYTDLGINSMIYDLQTANIARKVDKVGFDGLAPTEQEVLKSYNKKQEIEGLDLMKDRHWYRTGDGTGRSLVFMESMIVSGLVGGAAKGFTQAGLKAGLKGVINAGAESTAKKMVVRSLVGKGAFKILPSVAEVAVAGVASVSTYANMAQDQIGVTESVMIDGEEKILVRKSIYDAFVRDSETSKMELENGKTKLLAKQNRSDKENEELDQIEDDLDNIDTLMNTLRVKSISESLYYGWTETMKEYASEKFVGKVAQIGFNKVSGYVGKKLIEFGADSGLAKSLIKGVKGYNSATKKGGETFNKLTGNVVQHTGVGKLWNGIPGEMFEEFIVQATPTYNQDYVEQLSEFANPMFYADIAAQTTLMGSVPTTIGFAKNLINYRKNKELFIERENIRQVYRDIDKAVNSDQLANSIVMSTGGSGFSIAEYDHEIARLRNEGDTVKADKMEQKKFYNLAVKAMQTGTFDEFEATISNLLKSHNANPGYDNGWYSQELKANIIQSQQKVQALKKVYEKYKSASNLGQIMSLASDKVTGKQSIEEVDTELNVQALIAEEELKSFAQEVRFKGDFSMSTLFTREFTDAQEEADYNDFLDKADKAGLIGFQDYAQLTQIKINLNYAQNKTMALFNEVASPNYLKNVQKIKDFETDFAERLKQRMQDTQNTELSEEEIEAVFRIFNKGQIKTSEALEIKEKFKKSLAIESFKREMLEVELINDYHQKVAREKKQKEDAEAAESNVTADALEGTTVLTAYGNPLGKIEDIENNDPPLNNTEDINDTYPPISQEEIQANIDKEAKAILNATNSQTAVQDDPFAGGDNYAPVPMSIDGFSDDQREASKNAVKSVYDILTQTKGVEPSFQDLVHHFLGFVSEEQAESQFDAYKLGWEMNGYETTNFNDVYNSIFDPAKKITENALEIIKNLFNAPIKTEIETSDELAEITLKQEEAAEQKQNPIISFTEENVPVKAVGGKRIIDINNKLAFNAIQYDEVEDAEGVWRKVTSMTGKLNIDENGVLDFRDLLHPDKMTPGTKLDVKVVPESAWGKIKQTVGRDENRKPIVKTFAEIVAEKEAIDPNFRNTQEFKDIVPILVYNGNNAVSYVHEVNWYNAYNVGDPTKKDVIDVNRITPTHYKLIEEGKTNARNLRNAIFGGVSEITVDNKKDGAFYTVAKRTDAEGNLIPLMTITEANPQAVLAVVGNQGSLEVGTKKLFENETRKVIPSNFKLESGHTVNLRRIGIDPKDGKETWQAFGVVRYPTEQQMETVKWAWSAYAKLTSGKESLANLYAIEVAGTKYNLTITQANKIVADIKAATGYDLNKWQDAYDFLRLYVQPKSGPALTNWGKTLFKDDSVFKQHTLKPALSSTKSMVHINNGTVEDLKQTYNQYLMGTLQTDVKSFNVGTEQKPVYATSVQPIITFSYQANEGTQTDSEATRTPQETVDKIKEAVEEAKKELGLAPNVDAILDQFNELKNSLGFTSKNLLAAPTTMQSTDALVDIFNVTPGLSIGQEGHMVSFIYNYISSAIDIKYKSKISKAKLTEELNESYTAVVAPSETAMKDYLSKLEALNSEDTRVITAIAQAKGILNVFNNIKNSWTSKDIQETKEANGEVYKGELGILDKAFAEVSRTSDIKEERIDDEKDEAESNNAERGASFEEDASLTENGKQKTTYRLRRFMAGIERISDNGSVKTGFLKLPEYVGFNEVFDTLYQLLGTGVYIESDYETMSAKILGMQEAYPWVKQFITKMNEADSQLKNEFVTNYRKHAISMKFAMYTTNAQGTKLQIYDTNANEIKRVILDSWKNSFKTSPLANADGTINKEVAQKLLNDFNGWNPDKNSIPKEDVKAWLKNFGIELSEKYFNELVETGFYNGNNIPYDKMFSGSNTFMGGLQKYLVNIIKKEDTNFIENEKLHPFGDLNNVMKALTTGEARFTAKTMSKSFRDAGKNVSGVTVPNYITNKIDDLKRSALTDQQYINDLMDISITKNSLFLNLLKNDPEFAGKFGVDYLGLTSFKEFGKKANGFSNLRDLNAIDHDMVKVTGLQDIQQGKVNIKVGGFSMRIGRMFLPTMSDKKQMLMLSTGVFNFMEESEDAFTQGENGEKTFTPQLRELLYEQLVLPELTRIFNFHKNIKKTNNNNYDRAAQIFNFIPALNNIKDSQGIRLIKHLAVADETVTLEQIEELFKPSMMDVVEEVAHNLAKEKMEIWKPAFTKSNAKGEITSIPLFDTKYLNSGVGALNDKFENGTYDYVLNYMITNANSFTTLSGDPAMYSQNKLFPTDTPYDIQDDNTFITISSKMGTNLGKRLALMIAPGVSIANSKDQKYLQVFLRDETAADKEVAANAEYLIKLYHGQEGLEKAQPILDKYKEYKQVGNVDGYITERNKLKAMFKDISDYFNIDATDGQEYTTITEHLIVLEGMGRLNAEQVKTIGNKLLANEVLTKEDLKLVMQPIKPVYSGHILDKDQDMSRAMYIKSSSFPLIPQVTVGTKFDGLRLKLEEMEATHGKSVRASYGSANKVGAVTNPIDIFNPESLKNADMSMLEMSRNDFRIQQDVPYKSDSKAEKVSMGTQIFKLLMGDGMMDLDGFVIDGKDMNGRELNKYFAESFEKLMSIKRNNLFKELGLNEEGNPINEKDSILKLQELLKKEAIKRDYPIQDIKGLELDTLYDTDGNEYQEFRVPLWLSTNSNRYESLLNSIVSNRLMKHKIPGTSFVLGAETGFGFKEDLTGIDKSRVIYLDNWNGKELQGVSDNEGTFTAAQVFVPSKFKISDTELIDLFEGFNATTGDVSKAKYLKRNENGSLGLKEGMIAPELLNQFSFRTPTSSHVSGSTIEIAGFLPPEVGDLMIVPKNFTKQKGIDYDVDKETAYQLNYVVDKETGKMTVLTEKDKDNALKSLRNLLEKEDAAINSEFGLPSLEDFYMLLGSQLDEKTISDLQDQGASIQSKIDKIEAMYDEKLMENNFIKAHLAVYNNANPKVQKKINKVLSMSFAENQADFIEGLNEEGRKDAIAKELVIKGMSLAEAEAESNTANNSFTILSDEYQKGKMALGAAGKTAIGIYSNYVTFHALTQQTDNKLNLREKVGKEFKNKEITIGNRKSTGELGLEFTLDSGRTIAEVLAERQNTATDNEKAQILGRVNINKLTIGVDSLLAILGFDKDESGNSVSYTLLSQPILKQYVKKMEEGKGITATYQANLEKTIIVDLVKQFTNGEYTVEIGADFYNFKDKENNIVNLESLLTGQSLENGIKYNGENGAVQLAALAKFLELDQYAKNITAVQSLLNTNNLGKSIIEANHTYERLENFPSNKLIANVTDLIGDFMPIEDAVDGKPDGYTLIGDYYVKAKTPQGQIVVQGLTTGQKLWGDYFPFNDNNFKEIIREILAISSKESISDFRNIELKQEIVQEAKKYIYSWRKFGVFNERAGVERERLFMDRPNKTSLANYMNSIQSNETIKDNRLLSKFTYEVNTDGQPSLIKFNNGISDNFDEQYLYNSLAEMIIEDTQLPDWNGTPMTSRLLAQELITYAYTEGGVQEAVQFIKYVPVEYLSEVGIFDNGRFVPANEVLQRMNPKRNSNAFAGVFGLNNLVKGDSRTHIFAKQFMQHHPERATQYPPKEILAKFAFENSDRKSFILNAEESPKFITIRGKGKLKQDKYRLYQHVGASQYKEISVLGVTGMNEYEMGNDDAQSILRAKVEPTSGVNPTGVIIPITMQPTINIAEGDSVKEALQKVITGNFPKYKHLNLVAEAILPMIDDNTTLLFEDTRSIFGGEGAAGVYDQERNAIVIDTRNALPRGNESTSRTFIHEVVHAISYRELLKYYDQTGTTLQSGAPAHVIALHNVWTAFRRTFTETELKDITEKLALLKAKLPVQFTQREIDLGYGATNIFEFMSVAMDSDVFKTEMSKVKYDANYNIYEKFVEAIKKILASLNPDLKSDNLAGAALNEILNFITEESEINKSKKPIFDEFTIREDSAFEQEILDKMAMEQAYLDSMGGDPSQNLSNEGGRAYMPAYQSEDNLNYQLDTQNNVQTAIKELDNYLLKFLKQFNVKSKEFEDLKSKLGVNALGATDTLNKLIWYAKNRNEETLPEEAAHMLVMLMGEKNADIKELLENIENWNEYSDIEQEYLPIYKDKEKVKIEAIGKLIAKSLVSNYKTNGIDKTKLEKALQGIKEFIKSILENLTFSGIYQYNQSIADKIAINVLSGNKDYINKVTNNNSNVNVEKELKNNPLAQNIINTFSSPNIKMTGSLAIAGTENIRRPEGQGVHDLDFKVNSFKTYENEVLSKIPENAVPAHYGWHKKDYSTFAYVIPKEGYTINVKERKDDFSNGWITKYDVLDNQGNVVQRTQDLVVSVDFFVYKDNASQLDFNYEGKFIPASLVYEGKMSLGGRSNPYFFSRDKDQEDYVVRNPKSFIAFENSTFYQLEPTNNKLPEPKNCN